MKFGKTGNYEKTIKAFDLVGHNAGVWDFAFDQDALHCVTVCKDGYWRLFDINGKFLILISASSKASNLEKNLTTF